jgi:hypothetical protein
MKKLVAALLLISTLAGAGYYYWTTTPQFSLLQIKTAVDTHDTELFNKHVDIESLTSRAVDGFMEYAMVEVDTNSTGGMLGSAFAAGLVAMAKPKLVEYASNKILMEIEGENSSATEVNTGIPQASELDRLFNGADGDFRQDYLNINGRISFLGLIKYDRELDSEIIYEFKLRELEGYWQIVELSNLKDVLNKTEELREQKLAERNAPIVSELLASITVTDLFKRNVEERWSKKVHLGGRVTNLTTRNIESATITIEVYDESSQLLHSFNGRIENIEPKQSKEGIWEVDVNQFIVERAALYDANNPKMKVKPIQIEFSDGGEIKIATSL